MNKQHGIKINTYTRNMMEYNIDFTSMKPALDLDQKENYNKRNIETFIDLVTRLSEAQTNLSNELPLVTDQGHSRYILQQISIMPGYEDTWGRVIFADVDITERKKIEDELLKYKENLEQMVNTRTLQLSETNTKLEKEIKLKKIS
jgi:cobalamin biosynthesis Co2+ chelatase CbiK